MLPVKVEGARRNFTISSPFLYSVFLSDETDQRLLMFAIQWHPCLLLLLCT